MVGQTELSRSGPIVNQILVNAKKILITTESHEVFILRADKEDHAYGRCPDCGIEVEILTLDRAVSLSGIRTGDLVRLTEEAKVHSIETATGHLLICKESLKRVNGKNREKSSDKSITTTKID
jgi:hypothetical protein